MLKWFQRKTYGDPQIWLIVAILSFMGILVVYSATGTLAYRKAGGNIEFFVLKHIMFLAFGLLLMFLTQLINYKYYSRLSQLLLWLSLLLLPYTLFFGTEINNARRWLTIPGTGFTIQTSDLAKVAIIMFMARFLSKRQEEIGDFKKSFVPLFLAVSVVCLLIFPANLSTAAVLFFTCMVVMFIGRVPVKYLALVFGTIVIVGGSAAFIVMKMPDSTFSGMGRLATWKSRLETFVPSDSSSANELNDKTHQTVQARIAIAKGGLFGEGPGHSSQRNFLPNPFSDYIFAIIVEEYGFITGLFILCLYLWFLFRVVRIVIKAPKAFGALLSLGLAVALVIQALIHMAVNVDLFPVTGLPLPLISMGGTSMIFTSIAFGIILSVSRSIDEQEHDKLMEAAGYEKA